MTQSSITAWCETLQAKLMAALDAAWAAIEASDDPVVFRKARDKAKACGELATVARKLMALAAMGRSKPVPAGSAALADPASAMTQAEHALRALEQLKARRRR